MQSIQYTETKYMLTVSESSKMLGVSIHTVYNMKVLKIGRSIFYKLIQPGQLKGFKEGNRYKVPVESIEEYVDKKMMV